MPNIRFLGLTKLFDDPEDEHLNNVLYLSPHFLEVYGAFPNALNDSCTYLILLSITRFLRFPTA